MLSTWVTRHLFRKPATMSIEELLFLLPKEFFLPLVVVLEIVVVLGVVFVVGELDRHDVVDYRSVRIDCLMDGFLEDAFFWRC